MSNICLYQRSVYRFSRENIRNKRRDDKIWSIFVKFGISIDIYINLCVSCGSYHPIFVFLQRLVRNPAVDCIFEVSSVRIFVQILDEGEVDGHMSPSPIPLPVITYCTFNVSVSLRHQHSGNTKTERNEGTGGCLLFTAVGNQDPVICNASSEFFGQAFAVLFLSQRSGSKGSAS